MFKSRFRTQGRLLAAVAALVMTLGAHPALANAALRDNKHINDRLVAAQIGDYIRRACPSISPRLVRALSEMRKLESYAKGLGFSDQQIKDFINNKDEKARVRREAWAYMVSKGVVEGNAESYCRLGREEIAAGTITGSLLFSH